MYANDPSQLELQEAFEIVDGKIWRKEYLDCRNRKQGGYFINNVNNQGNGYCQVRFKKQFILYHRLLWILYHGPIPAELVVDHRDGVKLNNSISNLRLLTHRENLQNQYKHREDGAIPGVNWFKRGNRWKAQIWVEGKSIFLGLFDSQLAAFDAYIRANEERGYSVFILLELRDSWLQRQANKYRLTTWSQANENFAKKILDI